MKEIQLTQGQVAIVDDWWYDYLSQWKWCACWNKLGKSYYASRITSFPKRKTIYMSRIISKAPDKMECDHINHNTLDNRECNLRICTTSQNKMNCGKYSTNTSGYKGVRKHRSRWQGQITVEGKFIHLGTFDTPKEAALAYDSAARRLHGEFANLNFPKK